MTKVILIVALLLSACGGKEESSISVSKDFTVDRLFIIDSCQVYRFSDAGRYIYFTNCNGSTKWHYSCGKNCQEDNNVDNKVKP